MNGRLPVTGVVHQESKKWALFCHPVFIIVSNGRIAISLSVFNLLPLSEDSDDAQMKSTSSSTSADRRCVASMARFAAL